MATEEKRFVLYEYLLFFWKKKLWFIIITIGMMVIAAIASSVLIKHSAYEGNGSIFTGSINMKSLTDPKSIESKYGKDIKNPLNVVVSSDSYLKVKVSGSDRHSVEKDLNSFTGDVYKHLNKQYKNQYTITKDYIDALKMRVKDLNNLNDSYLEKISDNNLSLSARDSYTQLLEANQTNLGDTMTTLQRVKSDLSLFEKPVLLSKTVGAGKSYLKQSVAIGFCLGILFSFVILILWKYVFDARRYYN